MPRPTPVILPPTEEHVRNITSNPKPDTRQDLPVWWQCPWCDFAVRGKPKHSNDCTHSRQKTQHIAEEHPDKDPRDPEALNTKASEEAKAARLAAVKASRIHNLKQATNLLMLLASPSSAAGVATKAPKPTCQNSVLRCAVEVSATASAIAFRMLPRFVAVVYASTSASMAHMAYRGMGCAYFIPCHTTTARMHVDFVTGPAMRWRSVLGSSYGRASSTKHGRNRIRAWDGKAMSPPSEQVVFGQEFWKFTCLPGY